MFIAYLARRLSIPLAVMICSFICNPLWAQTQSLFGNRGPLGQSTGGSATSSPTATTRGAGGAAGAGIGGTSALNTQAGTGAISTDFGSGFVGRSENTGRLVGNQLVGQQQSQQTARFNAGRAGSGRFNAGNFNQSNSSSRRRMIRPRQRIAFAYRKRGTAAIGKSLKVRFERVPRYRSAFKTVSFEMNAEGRVILKGEVSSEQTRKLAANMVRLEPGVRSIQNELTVKPAPKVPSTGASAGDDSAN